MRGRRGSIGRVLFLVLLGVAALVVHLADGYAWCQEYWNWDGRRNSKDGHRWPAGDGVVITYINGIFHSVPEWESITHQLQAIFGHEVRAFYNPSSGWWITDASKAGYHLLRKPANDTIAQALGEHLAQAVEDVGRGRVLHIAHSGGALITYLAAQHHLTERQRDKIDVLTFGGARSITRKYFSGRVVNYYARNDPLVKLDRRAAELMKMTNNTKFQEVLEKHNTTFVFLEGRARQFVLDHSLEGPTYQHALRKEAKAFRRSQFGPLSPLSWDYESSLLRLARKRVAQLSGVHDFFSTERFGLRSVRKAVARLTGFHGFFSGKMPSAGVRVEVIGDGEGVPPLGQYQRGSWLSTFARRLLPWGEKGAEPVAVLQELGPPVEDGDGIAGDSRGRFWLGFRWGKFDREPEPAEESGGELLAVSIGDLGGAGEEVPRSRWMQLRSSFGFGRSTAPLPGTAEGGLEDDALLEPDSDDEEGPLQDGGVEEPSSDRADRPWLSIGWTPWGPANKPPADSSADEAPASTAEAEEEELVAVGVDGESSRDMPRQEGVSDPLPRDESSSEGSYLKRWWPSSSTRQETAPAAETSSQDTAEQRDEEQQGVMEKEGEEGGEGDEGVVDSGESDRGEEGEVAGIGIAPSSANQEQSMLWRWWPVGKEQEGAEAEMEAGEGAEEAVEAAGQEEPTILPQEVLPVRQEKLTSLPPQGVELPVRAAGLDDEDEEPLPVRMESLTSRFWPVFKGSSASGPVSSGPDDIAEREAGEAGEAPTTSEDDGEEYTAVGEVIVAEGFLQPIEGQEQSAEATDAPDRLGVDGEGEGEEGDREGAAEDNAEGGPRPEEPRSNDGHDAGAVLGVGESREKEEDEGAAGTVTPGVDLLAAGGEAAEVAREGVDLSDASFGTVGVSEVAAVESAATDPGETDEPSDGGDSAGGGGEGESAAAAIREKQEIAERSWGWRR